MSSRWWALYAMNRRLGQPTEHRLAGARLGQMGAMLRWRMPHGWRATIYVGPVSVDVTLKAGHERFEEWLEVVWPSAARNFR